MLYRLEEEQNENAESDATNEKLGMLLHQQRQHRITIQDFWTA